MRSRKMVVMPKVGAISDFWERLAEMVGPEFPHKNQKAVGKLFGVGQSMITRWKTGKDTPALPRAIEIAKEYGVCVEWLLTGNGPKRPGDAPDPELGRLLEFWDTLTPTVKHEVVLYAAYRRSVKESHEKQPRKNIPHRPVRAD